MDNENKKNEVEQLKEKLFSATKNAAIKLTDEKIKKIGKGSV